MPISGSNFDLSIRMFTFYWIGDDWDWEEQHRGGEAYCILRPMRGRLFSPYVGGGLRYEWSDVYDDGYGELEEKKKGVSLAGRVGILINLKRVFLLGEYIVGKGSGELVGDVSFYLTRRMKLHAFADHFDLDFGNGTAIGGGLSFDF